MLLRSSLSSATVSPRYSVSRTAVESSKFFVSSATDASFCAMATPCVYETLHDGGAPADGIRSSDLDPQKERAPAQAHGAGFSERFVSYTCAGPCTAELRSSYACTHVDDQRSSAGFQCTSRSMARQIAGGVAPLESREQDQ